MTTVWVGVAAEGDAAAAQAAADAAQGTANTALADAATAQAAADAAQADATTALADAAAAQGAAATAQADATQTQADANAAQSTADAAALAAAAAQADADTALAGLAGKQDTIAPGSAGNIAVSNGVTWVPTSTFGRSAPFFLECVTDPVASGLARSITGTGQISASSAYSADHPGQWNLLVGAATGSRATMYLGASTGGLILPAAGTIGQWEVMFQVPVISGGGQAFEIFCGIADSPANAGVVNGVYFYVDATNNFGARRTVGGVNTTTPIGVLVAGAWYRMRTSITGGNTVLSYAQTSDRTASLATVLTTPSIAASQSPQIKLVRSTGTTSRTLTADYFAWYFPNT